MHKLIKTTCRLAFLLSWMSSGIVVASETCTLSEQETHHQRAMNVVALRTQPTTEEIQERLITRSNILGPKLIQSIDFLNTIKTSIVDKINVLKQNQHSFLQALHLVPLVSAADVLIESSKRVTTYLHETDIVNSSVGIMASAALGTKFAQFLEVLNSQEMTSSFEGIEELARASLEILDVTKDILNPDLNFEGE